MDNGVVVAFNGRRQQLRICGVTKMTRDGSLVGAVPAPVLLPKKRWLTPTLQSIALMLLLAWHDAGRLVALPWPAAGRADYLAAAPALARGRR